ncbi:hypothetical protein ACFFV7_40150 [Nonomuraea spiralis]|uniref:Uncharacterized protein n=1 Tax=Nonomuraea spiralis TaxID=46182 RepID=A0ABV5IU70_9ACTN|nr:hypothetical protein [Nonomuraea spiralis]
MERPPLGMDELIEHWTVLSDEVGLVSAKQEGTRLAFALLLKYFTELATGCPVVEQPAARAELEAGG